MKAHRTVLISLTTLALGFAAYEASADEIASVRRMTVTKVVEKQTDPFRREYRVNTTVSAAGLDLSTPSGAATLKQRVNDAALTVCQEITRLAPNAIPDEPTCVKEAAKRAMVKVKSLETAAGLGK